MEKKYSFNSLYNYIKNDYKTKIVISTIFIGIAIHMFALTNVLHNHDNILNFEGGYGLSVTLGRWALKFMGGSMSKLIGIYNLPFFNGVMFILMLALSVWFIIDIFDIRSFKLGLVIGAAVVSFPTVTAIMFYRFTVIYYGVGILFSVLAVWFLEKFKYGWILSMLSVAVSLGFYQAYLPFTIAIMVTLLIQKGIRGTEGMDIIKKGIYYCLNLIGGLILYFVAMKISLMLFNAELEQYQGVSNMGQMGLNGILAGIVRAYTDFIRMPFYDFCDLAPNNTVKICYQILIVLCLIMLLYKISGIKKLFNKIIISLLILILPLAISFIDVMCPPGPYSYKYTLMVLGFAVILFIPVVLYESLDDKFKPGNLIKKLAVVIACVIIFDYAYLANVNYHVMYYANRQMENYMNSMVTQIRMTEGFKPDMSWAFIGNNINDPLYHNGALYTDELFGGNFESFLNTFSRTSWIEAYSGYGIPLVDESLLGDIAEDENVKAMPCWPEQGSVKIVNNTVVIKLEQR